MVFVLFDFYINMHKHAKSILWIFTMPNIYFERIWKMGKERKLHYYLQMEIIKDHQLYIERRINEVGAQFPAFFTFYTFNYTFNQC